MATHIAGTLEFANGAIATLIASFDVWDSELPRMEIYGTEGTLCIPDADPLEGPNRFGGKVLVRTRETSRGAGIPRPGGLEEWETLPSAARTRKTHGGWGLPGDMAARDLQRHT